MPHFILRTPPQYPIDPHPCPPEVFPKNPPSSQCHTNTSGNNLTKQRDISPVLRRPSRFSKTQRPGLKRFADRQMPCHREHLPFRPLRHYWRFPLTPKKDNPLSHPHPGTTRWQNPKSLRPARAPGFCSKST